MQVLKALDGFSGKVESEEELSPVEKMMSEAHQDNYKAVSKDVLT